MKPLLLALLLSATAAAADGLDDPNFYKDFDAHPCAYDLGDAAPGCRSPWVSSLETHWPASPAHVCNPDNYPGFSHCPPRSVPEPKSLSLLVLGLMAMAARKLFVKTTRRPL
jgi:hypothetical protein